MQDPAAVIDALERVPAVVVPLARELPPDLRRREADHDEYSHHTLLTVFRHVALHDFLHAYRVEDLLLKRDWGGGV